MLVDIIEIFSSKLWKLKVKFALKVVFLCCQHLVLCNCVSLEGRLGVLQTCFQLLLSSVSLDLSLEFLWSPRMQDVSYISCISNMTFLKRAHCILKKKSDSTQFLSEHFSR